MILRHTNILKNNSFFLFGARGTGKTTLLNTLFPSSEALRIDTYRDAHTNVNSDGNPYSNAYRDSDGG